MDNTKDGWSINIPPILNDTNYDYWKVKIVAFLKFIDIKTWKVVINGWNYPVIISQDGTTSLKLEADWSKDKDDDFGDNDKVLNSIFNGVDKDMFRLINTCTEAKEAWEIFKNSHKGTSKVHM